MNVVDSLPLGQNRLLSVVKWNGRLLLLGVTDHTITLLKETEDAGADILPDLDTRTPGPAPDNTVPDESTPERTFPDEPASKSFVAALAGELKKLSKRANAKRWALILILAGTAVFACAARGFASPTLPVPEININLGGESQGSLGTALGILGMLTVLTLAPAILILTTCFTRIVVVFSFLRSGLGTQQTPPNQVLVGIALLLTFFVMAPTWGVVNKVAIAPYIAGEIDLAGAIDRASGPIKEFMLKETRENDLALFVQMGSETPPESSEDLSLLQVVPAFAISELRTAFEMGFMLYLPFLVVDMVISSTLMSMGMLMLPPVLISLPFKILLFILVDGWGLITKSLIASFR